MHAAAAISCGRRQCPSLGISVCQAAFRAEDAHTSPTLRQENNVRERDHQRVTTALTMSSITAVPFLMFSMEIRSLLPCSPDFSASGMRKGMTP